MKRVVNEKIFVAGRKYKFCKTDAWYTCSECDFKKDHINDIFSSTSFLCKNLPCVDCNSIRADLRKRVCLHETI